MTVKFKQLINPHSHSESSLDGASSIEDIVAKNKALGATHVCATEHGNMNSAMDLVVACKQSGMKPILGIELYLIPPWIDGIRAKYQEAYRTGRLKSRSVKQDKIAEEIERKIKNYYFHLTVHFKTYQAYQHFCLTSVKMNERAVVKYGEVKALATVEDLIPIREQITVCSSCMVGPIGRTYLGSQDGVIESNPELAEKYYLMLKNLVGADNFFVEIFPHDITHTWVKAAEKKTKIGEKGVMIDGAPVFDDSGNPITEPVYKTEMMPGYFKQHECTPDLPDGDLQRKLNLYLLSLANKHQDKVLVSLDSHYASQEDKVVQDAKLGNGQEAWKFYNSYHVMSSEEAFLKLQKSLGIDERTFEQWVDNSLYFSSLFDDFKMPTSKDRWLLQDPPSDFMSQLKTKIDSYGRMDWDNQEMLERLQTEIRVIGFNKKKNLIDYLFTVEKIANFCRNNDVLINVRGSAGGSLLLYLLGVNAVNPLKHDLNFERFITEGRINANTLPDVDIDVSDQGKVFEFLSKEYGDRFCRLSMDTMLHLKSSIKDAERYKLGSVRPQTEALTKMLPGTPQGMDDKRFVFGYEEDGAHHPGLIETNAGLKTYADQNPEIWDIVVRMLGVQRNKSVHPCGIILMADPVQSCIPLISVNGTTATGFSPHAIEAAGGVKYDILGVNTLRDIQLCLKSIRERLGVNLDPWNLPYDERCFKEFAGAHTETVFQFDSPTVKPYLKRIRPKDIDGLAAVTALCRPGTLDAPSGEAGLTLAQLYVERANGRRIEYVHNDLEPILRGTYGISIFQETTLRMFRDLAGMSYEEAESVRRGIGKKDAVELAKNFGRLREGCLSKGWSNEQIDLLIEQIKASQRYSFNKSHAISYAYVAYACMWLKTNYALDWWKATLSNATRDEVAQKFWRYVKDIVVLPTIDNTSDNFQIVGNKLTAPLNILSGIGPKAYKDLISRGPYENFQDFITKHFKKDAEKSALNRPTVYKMLAAGVLDSMLPPNLAWAEKVNLLVQALGQANDGPPEKIDVRYASFSSLGQYLIKKNIISIYSDDLRPIMLPNRGGFVADDNAWRMSFDGRLKDIVDGWFIEDLKNAASTKMAPPISDVRVLGYVLEEKAKPYRNKTKQATEMVVDVNGTFYEEILWPAREAAKAPSGFKKLPCIFVYSSTQDRVFLKEVIPLLKKENMDELSTVS